MCRLAASISRLVAAVAVLLALMSLGGGVVHAEPAAGGAPPVGVDTPPRVLATTIDSAITPVVADHLEAGLQRARRQGYDAYLIELDTPGGLVTSMRDIVEDILASPVPVILYVSPDGARAGSAGAIITFASHVAVMAPGTSIGAATPVGMQGEDVSDKIVNDAAAQAESLAQLRGRNVEFAVDTVREGRSAPMREAVRIGAVDARAATQRQALAVADGMTVRISGDRKVTVQTDGAVVDRYDLGAFRTALQFLADPNVAFLLLTLGSLGLIYELATPGVGVAGATGATAFVLAMFSLSVLPVNVVGLLLLAMAIGLFVAELFAPGIAGFAFGGAVVLVLAALFLFDDAEGVGVDAGAAVPTAVLAGALAVLAGRVAIRARRQPSRASGPEHFTGRTVTVREADGPTGRTFTEGTWWSVRSTGADLQPGEHARVVGLDGLVMVVDPITEEERES